MKQICQDVTNVTKGHWRSVAVQAIPKPENCQVTEDIIASRCGNPGTRIQQYLSEGHSFAKTVTSLLTLPSVLCGVLICFCVQGMALLNPDFLF
jgi:hypothetical protein